MLWRNSFVHPKDRLPFSPAVDLAEACRPRPRSETLTSKEDGGAVATPREGCLQPAMMKMTHCRSLKEDGHTSRSQRLRVEHGLFFRCRAACESKRCSVRELNVLDAARGCLSPDQTGGRGAGGAWGGTAGAKNTVHFFYPLAIATSHPEKMSTLRWQPELVCGRVRPRRLSCREI